MEGHLEAVRPAGNAGHLDRRIIVNDRDADSVRRLEVMDGKRTLRMDLRRPGKSG